MLSAEQLQMRLLIHVSHQNAAHLLRSASRVPTLSWKSYMNMLQPKLQVIICCNARLIDYPGTPILNPLHTPKKTIVR